MYNFEAYTKKVIFRIQMEQLWSVSSAYSNSTAPWDSYQIRKIVGYACAGNAGKVFPAIDFKGYR